MTTEYERSFLRVLISNCSVELKSELQVDNGSSKYTVGEVKETFR